MKAFGGHGPCIDDPLSQIERTIHIHRSRTEHIAKLLESLGPITAYQLSDHFLMAIGKKTSIGNEFLALKETVGHLAVLQQERRLVWEEKEGAWCFSLCS